MKVVMVRTGSGVVESVPVDGYFTRGSKVRMEEC